MSLNNNQEAAQTREQLKAQQQEQTRSARSKLAKHSRNISANEETEKKGFDIKAFFAMLVETVLSWFPKRDRAAARTKYKTKEDTKAVEKTASNGRRKRVRIRLFPIWLRLLLITILVAVSALVGAYVGYSVIGEGNPEQTFDKSTWQHILDLVNKE